MGAFYTNFSIATAEFLISCRSQPDFLVARFLIIIRCPVRTAVRVYAMCIGISSAVTDSGLSVGEVPVGSQGRRVYSWHDQSQDACTGFLICVMKY